jgi:hypothetical protein
VLAWAQDTGADLAKTNVNGGAIAIGHPLGASGARLMTTLLNALERRGGRYGLQTMCEGGGMANATVVPSYMTGLLRHFVDLRGQDSWRLNQPPGQGKLLNHPRNGCASVRTAIHRGGGLH